MKKNASKTSRKITKSHRTRDFELSFLLSKLYKILKNWVLVLKNFSPVEKSIVVTLCLMMGFLFSLTIIHFDEHKKDILVEMNFIPDVDDEKINEEEEKDENITEKTKITLQAYNETDKNLSHADEPFKSLEEILAEREMQEAAQELLVSKGETVGMVLPTGTGLNEELTKVKKNEVANKNTLVKYALTDRTLRGDLPNPIFTCEEEGKVVVRINVNEEGKVIAATVDPQLSTTTNGCLIDNALAYARQARFNVFLERKEQKGTITYFFQPKR